jgi:hypothetical protein
MAQLVPLDLLPASLLPNAEEEERKRRQASNAVPMDMLPDSLRPSAPPQQNVVPADLLPTNLQPAEKPEDQSFFRKVADIPLQLQKGYVTGVRLISDAFGADSGISKNLRDVEEHIAGLMSAQSKKDSAEMARILKDAEDKGITANVVAGVKALSVAPIDLVVNALGTTAPTIIAGVVGGLPAAGALGITMGLGTVKSAVYEATKEVLADSKMSPAEIEAKAVAAQEYIGPNIDMIVLGGGLGLLESITGSQAAAKRIVDKILTRGVAREVAEETAKKSMAGAAVRGAFTEAVPEFFQGAQEQLARNVAQQREGFDVPTMRGVVSQGVLEAGAGAMIGGMTGPIELAVERRKIGEIQTKIDALQNTPPPPGSDEERVLKLATEIQARGNVDRQTSMILAMKAVADENILSEKVDGPKVAEATGNAPLFVFDTPEQAQERVQQLKLNRPKENFEVQGSPDGKFAIYKVPVETTGEANVTEPIAEAGGISPAMSDQRGVAVPAGGPVAPVAAGLDTTGTPTGQPAPGEAIQPNALVAPEITPAVAQPELTPPAPAATIEEEPSVTETPETVETEEEGQTEPAATAAPESTEVIKAETETETEAKDSIDKATEAIEELLAASEKRTAEAEKREEGQGEPASMRRMTKKASEALEAAITGKSGIISTIGKLDVAIDRARSTLEAYGGEEFDEDLLRERGLTLGDKLAEMALEGDEAILSEDQKARVQEQDLADMRDAYAQYNGLKALRAQALRRLATFESDPTLEGHPSKGKALDFIRTLPYEDKLTAYTEVSEEVGRRKEQMEEVAAEPKAPPKSTTPPVVTVKKKRRSVDIPAASQARVPKRLGTSLTPDPTFNKFSGKSITEALAHIATTGNPFEKALATRLLAKDNRAGIKDTKFYTVTDLEAAAMPEMDGAGGLYVLDGKKDDIYVRKSGPVSGINNQIILHEATHATVNKRLIYAMYADELGLAVPKELKRVAEEMTDLMNRARVAAMLAGREYQAAGEAVPDELVDLIEGDAFHKVTEFVAYGMTDPYMQKFLRESVVGVVTRTNGFSEFVRQVMGLLGLTPEHVSGLRDLIEYTDRLAASVDVGPDVAKAIIDTRDSNKVTDIQAVSRASKKKELTSEQLVQKIEESGSADQLIEELGSLSTVAKNPKLWGEYFRAKFTDINVDAMNVLLAAMPTEMVVSMGVDKGIVRLGDIDSDVREVATMRTKLLNRVQEISVPWIKLSAPVQKQLGKVMSYATLSQIDPAKEKGTDKTLDDMYKALTPDAQAVYKTVRDFYQDQYDAYRALLERAAERMGGKEGAPETLTAIKALYEVGKTKGPYFPLMRYGQFYARFGKGANKEFYMFESAGLRDAFVTRRIAELTKNGETRTFDEMMETDDVDRGNDVDGMRKEMLKDNVQLRNMFDLIDKASNLGDAKAKESLKDQVYQMQLLAMPEASMRKHFIHRKGVTGFNGDALRNFLNSGTRMASQMARVRYSADINNNLSAAKESLKGNPEKDKLAAIIKEVEARVNDEMNPPIDDSLMEKLARRTNKIAFVYLLTSVKSAANQMFSVLNFTLPTLAARHGWGATLTEMSKYMALGYGQLGIVKKNADGSTSWIAPTVGLSDRVAKDPDEMYAYQRMQDMGISDMTRTYDLFMRRGQPSEDYNSRWNKVTNMMGALFHHSERISREITFMTSFRLTKGKGMTLEQRVDQATKDTNTALFDYSAWNRPRILRPAPVRIIAQFKQFPMYVTLYLARNGYNMIKSGATLAERKEAATMLFGTLGMTALMAGASGMVGYSAIMGTIQGIRNALRDADEEDPLEEMDFEMWFRNIYLPELCGDTKIMGMKLSELIDSGVLNTATGLDVASGISLNNMWFHDTAKANTWKDSFDSTMISLMGPGVSVGKQVLSGIDDFNNGDFLKAIEKFSPAFVRGSVTSLRYSEEGAKSSTGAEIKAAEEFTNAQLIAQAMGFRTTGLAQIMNNNFAVQQLINEIKNNRGTLMKQLDHAIAAGSEQSIEEAVDNIDNFNGKYPTYRIKQSEIVSSLKSREKIRSRSEAGMYLDKRSSDFGELRQRALDNLESEAAKK